VTIQRISSAQSEDLFGGLEHLARIRPVATTLGESMKVYQIDPTTDARWTELVDRHPKASVFHTVGWLKALQRTYGYSPIAFTTSSPSEDLQNGLVFCDINSWLTGRRLVSLPFSDHCEPICDTPEDVDLLIRHLQATLEHHKWKYLEVRPIHGNFDKTGDAFAFRPTSTFFLHRLDLHPDLNDLFCSFDKDSVQRRIHRAERAGLVEKCGRSDELLKEFYTLFIMTRRRHHLPPIPHAWFRNLIGAQGDALEIRMAYKDKTPIAAILTLQFRNTVYYKYGCSDKQFSKFGATPWLLWNAIVSAKSKGANEFDLGRTQEDNAGLLAFKNHWLPKPEKLVYWKFPDSPALVSFDRWKLSMAKRIFSYMPEKLLTISGRLIYRHIG
jgi:hypothetical protein